MNREQYIEHIHKEEHMDILYAFHLEKGKYKLTVKEFDNKISFFTRVGLGNAINSLLEKVEDYYGDKFKIVYLVNKEGQRIII